MACREWFEWSTAFLFFFCFFVFEAQLQIWPYNSLAPQAKLIGRGSARISPGSTSWSDRDAGKSRLLLIHANWTCHYTLRISFLPWVFRGFQISAKAGICFWKMVTKKCFIVTKFQNFLQKSSDLVLTSNRVTNNIEGCSISLISFFGARFTLIFLWMIATSTISQNFEKKKENPTINYLYLALQWTQLVLIHLLCMEVEQKDLSNCLSTHSHSLVQQMWPPFVTEPYTFLAINRPWQVMIISYLWWFPSSTIPGAQ